jgi:hypothetical protein
LAKNGKQMFARKQGEISILFLVGWESEWALRCCLWGLKGLNGFWSYEKVRSQGWLFLNFFVACRLNRELWWKLGFQARNIWDCNWRNSDCDCLSCRGTMKRCEVPLFTNLWTMNKLSWIDLSTVVEKVITSKDREKRLDISKWKQWRRSKASVASIASRRIRKDC